ncbi:MAG: hypothetical protein SFU56_10210 [Capsulimonadales bacterium]|nr:hypothetical protein [Capsulimonadales bacterium]
MRLCRRMVSATFRHPAARFAVALSGLCFLTGPIRAQVYVTSDTTLDTEINDLVIVGEDSFGLPFPGVQVGVVTGARLTAGLNAFNASTIDMTGGILDTVLARDSAVNISGGSVEFTLEGMNSAISVSGNANVGNILDDYASSLTVSGGALGYAVLRGTATITGGTFSDTFATLEARGNGVVSVEGGSYASGFLVFDNGTLTVRGSGLASSVLETGIAHYDASTTLNYLANRYSLQGTLADGTAIDTEVQLAGGVTGNGAALTFSGIATGTLAPDLYVTADGNVSAVLNDVYVGVNQASTLLTSPTVIVDGAADLARLTALNSSQVTVFGEVRDTVFARDGSHVDIRSALGAVIAGVAVSDSASATIRSGNVDNLSVRDTASVVVSDGGILVLSASGLSDATVNGGVIDRIVAQENALVSINGGFVEEAVAYDTSVIEVRGGSIGELVAVGATITMTGGTVANSTLVNLRDTFGQYGLFQLLGSDFVVGTNGVEGTYDDGNLVWSGVYWTLTGRLLNGDILDTRYFEADGELVRPRFRFEEGYLLLGRISAPEPGSLALLGFVGLPVLTRFLRRSRR